MPDMNTPGSSGQGAAETPANQDGQGLNYEQAYGQLRPEYTRTTQELAQARDSLSEYEALFQALHDPDPEVQRAAFDALNLDLAEDTGSPGTAQGDDEFVDPLEEQIAAQQARIDALESARELEAAEREQQELDAMRDDYIGEGISLIEQALSTEAKAFKFSTKAEEVLGNLAIAMTGPDGLPDVRGAYSALYSPEGLLEDERARWISTKTDANPAPLGTTIPAEKKPRTAQERIQYADERWAQLQRQQ